MLGDIVALAVTAKKTFRLVKDAHRANVSAVLANFLLRDGKVCLINLLGSAMLIPYLTGALYFV